jgi:hypothetical protein
MKRYGLSLYDANGQIKTMPELADNLQRSFKNLTPAQRNMALGVIFGSRAIQGANILIKDGEKKNRAWIKSVNDQGFAAHQASGKMDSLKGDLKKLGAALDNSFIDTAGDQSGLRGLVKDITSLVKAYNRLSDSQKGLVLKGFRGCCGGRWVAVGGEQDLRGREGHSGALPRGRRHPGPRCSDQRRRERGQQGVRTAGHRDQLASRVRCRTTWR